MSADQDRPPTRSPVEPAEPRLDDDLGFALYSANLAFGRAYRPILDALGLTYTQWLIVVALWEQEDRSVRDLGEALFLKSNTLTPILKTLEALGHVVRRRDPLDERQVLLTLTPSGRALREQGLHKAPIEAAGLQTEALERVRDGVKQLRDGLIRATGGNF